MIASISQIEIIHNFWTVVFILAEYLPHLSEEYLTMYENIVCPQVNKTPGIIISILGSCLRNNE
jgi:hypothetical protein